MLKKIQFFLLFVVTFFCFGIRVEALSLDCNQYLSKGSTGKNVRTLQTMLNNAIGCQLDIDGIFGQATDRCVRTFQSKYGLSVDGIVGPNTCTKLKSLAIVEKSLKALKNKVIVIANEANIRARATTSSTVLKTVSRGKKLRVVGVNGNWYKVKISSGYGYIRSDLVSHSLIILDISEQMLFLYQNGKNMLIAPVVTGNAGNHDTPIGRYTLRVGNMSRNEVLRGKNDDGTNYASYVQYWMPFITDRGIGFHDASWRRDSSFGTNTYQYNGSHGCVNMKTEDAQKLYTMIYEDTAVFVRK